MIHFHRRAVLAIAVAIVLAGPLHAGWFFRGDANGSGSITVSDGIAILRHLFAGGTLPCLDAADANNDNSVEITDAIHIFYYLFLGGSAPSSQVMNCWPDLTGGGLGCESSPACQPVGIFFVVHRGGLMYKVWKEVQREVIELIDSLSDGDEFGIAAFDASLLKFPSTVQPATATAENRTAAINWVNGRSTGQGSCARAAFLASFAYGEQSRAASKQIYYISNGFNPCPGHDIAEYESTLIKDLQSMNVNHIPIHAVCLGSPENVNEEWMKLVASTTGGTYIRIVP